MRRKRVFVGLAVLVVALGIFLLTPAGDSVLNIGKLVKGLYNKGVFEKAEDRTYHGDAQANLKALYTGMMFVHDSDGQFPLSAKWMDAVENRIKTGDMTAEEAEKKLHDPALGADPKLYGFAMNDACSGKYKDDLKNKKTILLFTSQSTARNAHGDPEKDRANPPRGGGNWGVTIAGEIVKL